MFLKRSKKCFEVIENVKKLKLEDLDKTKNQIAQTISGKIFGTK